MSTDMQERIARNEAAFRRINEDIERGHDADDDATLIAFVCECGSADCGRLIELTPAEYEQVRRDPRSFAIVSGHEITSVESVVERHDRYAVVRKLEDTGAIAKETDPRA
ncbi:MAG: hypothetical protein ACRDK0_09890 [Solirubrobacteraceae bacterium]